MKIFPPLSELLWPQGVRFADLVWMRRYPLAVLAIASATLIWSARQLPDHGRPFALTMAGHVSCTTLPPRTTTASVASAAQSSTDSCTTTGLTPGSSIRLGLALARANRVLHNGELTAADREIHPPALLSDNLRTTVFDPAGRGEAPSATAAHAARAPRPANR